MTRRQKITYTTSSYLRIRRCTQFATCTRNTCRYSKEWRLPCARSYAANMGTTNNSDSSFITCRASSSFTCTSALCQQETPVVCIRYTSWDAISHLMTNGTEMVCSYTRLVNASKDRHTWTRKQARLNPACTATKFTSDLNSVGGGNLMKTWRTRLKQWYWADRESMKLIEPLTEERRIQDSPKEWWSQSYGLIYIVPTVEH